MKRITRFSFLLVLMCLLAACGGRSFITDAAYRRRVEQDFSRRKAMLPQGDLFAVFDMDLPAYEREALEFLYAYMPLADSRLSRRVPSDEYTCLSEGGRGDALGKDHP